VTVLGLEGEIQILRLLQKYDLQCLHRLEQSRITDFMSEADASVRKECEQLLRRNRMLPRDRLTYQVDLFAWKKGHWAAMAIEEKAREGAQKILGVTKDYVTLKALCIDSVHEYRNSGREFFLQCCGEALLSQAFCAANGIDATVIPVGVADYDIQVNENRTNWAYHRGVFFVNSGSFEWFLNEYLQDKRWIRKIVESNPRLDFNRNYYAEN
jgi:hypothetical protein